MSRLHGATLVAEDCTGTLQDWIDCDEEPELTHCSGWVDTGQRPTIARLRSCSGALVSLRTGCLSDQLEHERALGGEVLRRFWPDLVQTALSEG